MILVVTRFERMFSGFQAVRGRLKWQGYGSTILKTLAACDKRAWASSKLVVEPVYFME